MPATSNNNLVANRKPTIVLPLQSGSNGHGEKNFVSAIAKVTCIGSKANNTSVAVQTNSRRFAAEKITSWTGRP